jgi:hypothetical protein
MWQHSDDEAHVGVSSAGDCSIYNGTVNDLLALINTDVEDTMSTEEFRTIVAEEVKKAVTALHAEHVLLAHGDATHPYSLDSISKGLSILAHGDADHAVSLDSLHADIQSLKK